MKNNDKWLLILYIAGQTPKCIAALNNLKIICKESFSGRYSIKVIDLLKHPQLARDHQIVAIPTLIRRLPTPIKKAIGDLSDREKVIVGLELRETK